MSSVLTDQPCWLDLTAALDAPLKGREGVAALLQGWGSPEDRDTARLLTSVLVTTAVMHTGSASHRPIRVAVRHDRERAQVRVISVASGVKRSRRRLRSGRGLTMVDRLAESFTVQAGRFELICDFTLRAHPPPLGTGDLSGPADSTKGQS
jgi:anti-sigma regulatory factor (Ser/Thr protein kinase)